MNDRPAALDGLLGYVADNLPAQPAAPLDRAQLAGILAAHTDSLAATIRSYTEIAPVPLHAGMRRAVSFLDLYKQQLLTGQWTPEMRRLLDAMLDSLTDQQPKED